MTGLEAEARIARRLGWRVAVGGGTAAGARAAAMGLAEQGATALVSFGLAGGLDPALEPGAVIVPEAVWTAGVRLATDAALSGVLGGPTPHDLLGAETLAATAGDKRRLWRETGCAAIDLESGPVAEVAHAHGLRFAVLRAVCDPADVDLPPAALVALSARGRIGVARVLVSVARAPGQMSALLRLARAATQARGTLAHRVAAVRVAGVWLTPTALLCDRVFGDRVTNEQFVISPSRDLHQDQGAMTGIGEGGEQTEIVRATTANTQVVSAIKDYCRFKHAQGFAIMIDGKWGSGKTHLMKSILGDLIEYDTKGPSSKPLYISLYGVKNVDEISDLIYQQLHPVLSSKPIRIGGMILKAIAKGAVKFDVDAIQKGSVTLTPSLSDLGAFDFIGGTPRSVVIFDDFERAAMPASEILGYINPFVEHDNCKVIVVANESEIPDQKDYRLRKEKAIGRTYEILPDAESAFEVFNRTIEDEGARDFVSRQKGSLLTIFRDSESGNLRSLKQSLWEFERLWRTLTPDQRSNEKAMHELLGLMCAVSFEIRSNRIKSEVIHRQDVQHFMRASREKVDPETAANEVMYKRYPSVAWSSTLLSSDTLRTIIEKGRIDPADIQRQFGQHPYFASPQDMPSWMALWRSHELPEAAQNAVLKRFYKDFEARTFRSYEEVLHVIGLCLWLAEIGQDGWPTDTVVDRLRAYITAVYGGNDATIDDVKPQAGMFDSMDGAYGLGFMMNDDPRFKQLASELRREDEAWRCRALPQVAARLTELMVTDGETFLREVCYTSGGSSRFAGLPVLHSIPSDKFAEIFIDNTYENQKNIMIGLAIRYERALPGQDINVEVPWARVTLSEILSRCLSMSPIRRKHVSSLAKHYLEAALSKIPDPQPSPETRA